MDPPGQLQDRESLVAMGACEKMPIQRPIRVVVQLSKEEKYMLDAVSNQRGLKTSDALRQGIRYAFKRLKASGVDVERVGKEKAK